MSEGRFPPADASVLVAACHRRCCICHRFCGSKMELDHMVQRADGGADSIDNAIPVCFDCHAEIHAYNDRHPRGRKFRPEELKLHKSQWLEICLHKPSAFDGAAGRAPAGPLEAMLDELDFNLVVAGRVTQDVMGCLFLDEQFRRAIAAGSIALLDEPTKEVVLEAYAAIGLINQHIEAMHRFQRGATPWAEAFNRAQNLLMLQAQAIRDAHRALSVFVGAEVDNHEAESALEQAAAPAPAVGFEDTCRAWAQEVRRVLSSGVGNSRAVGDDEHPYAEWAVANGLLAWDPDGDGVMLPGMAPRI